MFRQFRQIGILAAVLAISAIPQDLPKTADGHPDLQGNWFNPFATPLERPIELQGRPLLTDQEVAELNQRAQASMKEGHVMVVPSGGALITLFKNPAKFATAATYDSTFFTELKFENRTSLITDPPNGRLPEYTELGKLRLNNSRDEKIGAKGLAPSTRCISFGMPRIAGVAGVSSAGIYAYYQIVQTSHHVVFFMEAIHEARIIAMHGPHLPPSIETWDGDSRGKWDGDTLVVDTTNFRPEVNFLGAGENLHLIERFRLTAADELRYEVRVDDPTTWVRPWTAVLRLKRTSERLYEFACHEGNAETMKAILAVAAQSK